jgi:hypothetical protein
VCVIDECFDLRPPPWLKQEWLSNPESTRLFIKFTENAPPLWPQNTTTHQGFYCMTADGEYLAGGFARTSREKSAQLMADALARFDELAQQRDWKPKPIPNNRFELTMGEPTAPGGIKLEVASRDLPRGNDRRPGKHEWERGMHNLTWHDLPPAEAARFVTDRSDRVAVPNPILEKLAMTALRDNVRGQNGWKKGAFREGQLYTQLIERRGDTQVMRLSGYAIMNESGRVLASQLHGKAEFNSQRRVFESFELVASGQRQGAAGANGRGQDPGPAPMGVALRMYQVPAGRN